MNAPRQPADSSQRAQCTSPETRSLSVTPRSRRGGRWLIASCLIAVIMIAVASQRIPCEPASGTGLQGERGVTRSGTSVAVRRLRIATFNIHSGVGTDGRFDLDRIADALREFDVVGLNEVRGPRPWCADQAAQLAERAARSWLFAPFERRWFREDFGNGILAHLPISEWKRTPLPCTTPKGHGNLLELTLETRPRPVRILVTHIDRETDHDVQLQTVIARFLEVPPPSILMGDLNSTRSDPQLDALLQIPDVRDALREGPQSNEMQLVNDSNRIDWIITRGLVPIRGEIRSTVISDHPLVCAELEFEHEKVPTESGSADPKVPSTAGNFTSSRRPIPPGAPSRAALLHTGPQTLK